jgi:hypothetical protein
MKRSYQNDWGPKCNNNTNVALFCKQNLGLVQTNEQQILFLNIHTSREKLMPPVSTYRGLHDVLGGFNKRFDL